MLRKVLTSSIIVSQLLASSAFAGGSPVFYYRHNASKILLGTTDSPQPEVPGGPGDPGSLSPFVARNINGDSDVSVVGAKEANLSISLFNSKTGEEFADAQSWELVSGKLPIGVFAEISTNKATLRLKGIPTEAGEFRNIVYRVKDSKGNAVETKPLSLVAMETTLLLYPFPSNIVSVKARSQSVQTKIEAINVRKDAPIEWEVSGILPAGISYTIANDALTFSGVADVGGIFKDIIVTARDKVGRVASIPVEFHVSSSLETVNSRDDIVLENPAEISITTTLRDPDTKLPYTKGATWTQSGNLPQGVIATLSADRSQVTYSGTPTETGYFKIVWVVDDGSGNYLMSNPVRFHIGTPAVLEIGSSRGSAVNVMTMEDFTTRLYAQNTADGLGIPNGNWTITGQLPAGLTFTQDDTGATISGVPQKPGTYSFTVAAKDSEGKTDDLSMSFVVADGIEMTQRAEFATIDKNFSVVDYDFALRSKNASSNPYVSALTKWELSSGELPTGLQIEISPDKSSLHVKGTATKAGFFGGIIFKATDAFGNSYLSNPLAIQVIDRKSLQLVKEGYEGPVHTVAGIPSDPRFIRVRAINLSGTVKPGDWTVTGVPDGMTFDADEETMTLKGVPKKIGSYVVKVTAKDALGEATLDIPVDVINGLSAANYNPVSETIKQYVQVPDVGLTALVTSANEPYRGGNIVWTQIRGALPPGISMSPLADGSVLRFKGTSDVVGVWDDIVFRGTDVNGNTFDTKPFAFTVEANNDPLKIDGPTSTVNAMVDTAYSAIYGVSGLSPKEIASASNWTINGLPDGLKATVSGNGQLVYVDGTFKKSGTYNASLTFRDSYGRTGTYSIVFKLTAVTYEALGGEQGMEAYVTPADVTLKIRAIGSGEPYTGGATWALAPGNTLPRGLVGTPSADGSRLEIRGYATAVTSGWQYVNYRATLKDGTVLETAAGFFVLSVPVSLGENQSATTPKNVPFYREFNVTGFGAPNPMTISNVTSTTLPAGLSIRVDGSRVIVEGTPTTVGKPVITLTVTDQYNRKGTAKLTMNITAS